MPAKWSENTAAVADDALYANGVFNEDFTATNNEKCPGCGDNMRFDPESRRLKCPSCGTIKLINEQQSIELDFSLNTNNNGWAQETHTYHCNNCNAEGVLDKREIAHVCPFCGSPSVVENSEINAMRPNAIIPFAVSKDNALEIAHNWAKKKLFAPRDFKTHFSTETINGVYLPAFTFDMNTYSTYNGMLGEYYYVTKKVNGQTVRERRTRYFPVAGNFEYFFNDLAVSATDEVPDSVMQTLMYYNYAQSVEYQQEYLFGYSALLYKRDGNSCLRSAQGRTKSAIRSGILRQYNYDTVQMLNVSTSYFNIKFRYVLLPMYICNFTYKEKSYPFYVNGETGKIKGSSPVSALKVGLCVGAALIAVAAIALVAFLLLH